jgi:hypothetical protein
MIIIQKKIYVFHDFFDLQLQYFSYLLRRDPFFSMFFLLLIVNC